MLKFKFDYQENILSYQLPGGIYWHPLTETFEGSFGSLGFQLSDGWITFTVYSNKIRVFYKQIPVCLEPFKNPPPAIFLRKDLPKECPVVFEFSRQDEVEKVGNIWVKKGGSQM